MYSTLFYSTLTNVVGLLYCIAMVWFGNVVWCDNIVRCSMTDAWSMRMVVDANTAELVQIQYYCIQYMLMTVYICHLSIIYC